VLPAVLLLDAPQPGAEFGFGERLDFDQL